MDALIPRTVLIAVFASLGVFALPTVSLAVPFDPAVNIIGTISLDTTNSTAPTGNATQSGTLAITSGGVPTSTTFTNLTPSGANPLSAPLTDIGDNVSTSFTIGGFGNPAPSQNEHLFGNYILNLANSSLTDTFEVVFGVSLANNLSATGADTFVIAELRIDPTTAAIVFDRHARDTVNGNTDDNGVLSFSLTLAPSASIQIPGLQELRGGSFALDSIHNGVYTTALSVATVRNLTNGGPTPVPEPGSFLLLGIGLAGITFGRLKR